MRLVTAALVTFLAVSAPSFASSPAPKAPAKKAALSTIRLTIDGMHCDGCAKGVAKTLQEVKGVKSAKVTFASKGAVVEHDPAQVSSKQLLQAVQKSGYGAMLAK
jgi:copper chaperone CopZ